MADGRATGTGITKRSLTVAGHLTSVSLEDAFWDGLKAVADRRGASVAALVAAIDTTRGAANLSSAIRVFVLAQAQALQGSPLNRRAEDRPIVPDRPGW